MQTLNDQKKITTFVLSTFTLVRLGFLIMNSSSSKRLSSTSSVASLETEFELTEPYNVLKHSINQWSRV